MIRLRYAATLARTKLQSRKGSLFTTIAVSSILFSVLIAIIIVFTAVEKSTMSLVRAANNDQYLVKVSPVLPGGAVIGMNPVKLTANDIKLVRDYEADYYKNLKNKYTTAGLKYIEPDPSDSLLIPNAFADPATPSELRYRLNFNSSLMRGFEQSQLVAYSKTARNTFADLQKVVDSYHGSGYYNIGATPLPPIPNQLLIIDDKETFNDNTLKAGDMTLYGYSVNAIHNSSYEMQDQQLLSRYITYRDTSSLKGIPVLVTAQEAATLFGGRMGIASEPESDTAKQSWLKEVKQKLTGQTYQSCYRNQPEQQLLAKIQQDYANIESHKNDKDYKKPSLIYSYPSAPCGDIAVQSDTRDKIEKDAEAARISEEKKLGMYEAPSHRAITYQIVGFITAQPYSDATKDISSYFKNLLSYHADLMGAVIPEQMYQSLPDNLKFSPSQLAGTNLGYTDAAASLAPHIVAFSSIEQARAFISNEGCSSSDTDCKKLFHADPYGSNYLILDEVGKLFSKIMLYILPAVMILAGLIIWFMMSRVMSDNRKETAVYRAMGARRIDIAFIYLTYTLILSILTVFTSFLMGITTAYILNETYGKQLADTASLAFGVGDSGVARLSLFDVSSPMLLYAFGTILCLCLVAVIQPLIRNVLRPPIRDIRTE